MSQNLDQRCAKPLKSKAAETVNWLIAVRRYVESNFSHACAPNAGT
jgi:hypothetical protein